MHYGIYIVIFCYEFSHVVIIQLHRAGNQKTFPLRTGINQIRDLTVERDN